MVPLLLFNLETQQREGCTWECQWVGDPYSVGRSWEAQWGLILKSAGVSFRGWRERIESWACLTVASQTFFPSSTSFPLKPSLFRVQLREQHLYYEDKLLHLENIIIFPNYTAAARGGDVALLKLKNPVELSSHIKLISLPTAKETFPLDSECWVTGWGDLNSGGEYGCQDQGQS